jgi:hypothetical protein
MRCYVRDHPQAGGSNLDEGSAGANIMATPPSFEAKFARVFNALSKGKMNKIARFTPNPEAYWGPGTRAGKKEKPPKENKKGKRKGINGDTSAPKQLKKTTTEEDTKTTDNTTTTDNNNDAKNKET